MAKNFWDQDAVASAAPAAGDKWWESDKPAAQRDLPADVTPSAAGGGRGSVQPAGVQPAEPAVVDRGPADDSDPLTRVAPSAPRAQPTFTVDRNRTASVMEDRTVPEAPFNPAEGERLSLRRNAEVAPPTAAALAPRTSTASRTMADRGAMLADAALPVRAAARAVTGATQGAAGVLRAGAEAVGADRVAEFAGNTASAAADYETGMGNNKPVEGFGPKSPVPYLRDMGEGAAASLMTTGAAATMFGARAVIPLLSIQSAGAKYDEARKAGLEPAAALANAVPTGAFEAIGEKFQGLDKATAAIGVLMNRGAGMAAKRTAADTLVRAGIREVPGEVVTYLGQTGVDLLPGIGIRQDLTMGQFLDGLRDTVVQSAMMGTAIGGTGAAARPTGAQPLNAEAMARARGFLAAEDPRVARLKAAGEKEAAGMLERQLNAAAVENELPALGDRPFATDPGFKIQYRALRTEGVKPVEAASRAAMLSGFENIGSQAGLSDKAVATATEAAKKMPMDKVPGFLDKFTAALIRRGMGAPLPDGTVADAVGALRDDAMQSVTDTFYADTPADTAAAITDLENAQNPTADAQTVEVDAQTPAFDAGNDVIVTPEADRVHTAATSPLNDLPEPTDAQKAAGNYKVGRLRIAGMDISVENPQGSTRRGTDADGKPWETPMRHHYGYFKGTTGNDGDKLDVFVKPGTPDDYRGPVFVVDQVDPKTGKLDEHKVILGAADEAEAEAMYRANYDAGWQGLGAITRLPLPAFKAWAKSGALKEPLGDITQAEARAAAAPAEPAAPVPAPAADPADAQLQPPAGDPAVADGTASQPDAALTQAQPQQQQQANAAGRRARAAAWEKNPLMAFLAQHGIRLDLAAEFAPGPKERRRAMEAGYGPVFRRAGLSIDKLAELAAQDGFLPPGSRDADALYAMIGRAIRGERVAPLYAEGAVEQEVERRMADRADEPTPEEMDAIADLSELAENELDAIEDLVDDVPDFDAQSNTSTEDAMRAMGFSEQEISDAQNRQATEESAGPPADGEGRGQPDEAAAAEAPRADRGREGPTGRDGVGDADAGPVVGADGNGRVPASRDRPEQRPSVSGLGEGDGRARPPSVADRGGPSSDSTGTAQARKAGADRVTSPTQTPAPAGVSASGLTWELRPSGTLAVKGDTAAIKAKLASLPPKTLMVMQGGIMVGKTQVQKALDILEDKPAPAPAAKPLSMGTTLSGADPVTVKDGVVFIGKYEALDYDSGEPITVPAGATDEQVKKALRDGGVLGKRQKFFGGTADASIPEGAGTKVDTLTTPTKQEVLDQQQRRENADDLDQREQIQREASGFQLQAQAPEQRKDNTGDMFGGPTAEDVARARKPGKQQEDDGTAPLFSRGRIDEATRAENLKRWSNNAPYVSSAAADTYDFKTGQKVIVEAYHGTARPDRVGTVFQRKRATSGPMAFFNSAPELASSYAQGKQDTSITDDERNYPLWFKYKPAGQRSAVDIVRAWNFLPEEAKARIAALAPRIKTDDATGEQIELGPEGTTNGVGNYEWELQQTQRPYDRRGNPLKALVEGWLNGAMLFNEEERFLRVLELAGFPVKDVTYDAPNATYPFVYKTYIAMQKPLVTGDVPQPVIDALKDAAKRDRSRAQIGGADMWDKNTRTLREWVANYTDPANDSASYVWTSIPDKVTEVLKSMGYDGIIDWSGKGGGDRHPVYIPFDETQVKSATGNKGTFDPMKKDIMLARGKPAGAVEFTRDSKVKGIVYHATRGDFNVFDTERSDLGVHVGTLEQANNIVARRNSGEGNVMPLYIDLRNPLRLKDVGTFHADGIAVQLERKGLLPKGDGKRIEKEIDADWKLRKKYDPMLRKIIQDAGYDGIVYSNTAPGEGAGDSYLLFEPTQLKSATGNNGDFDAENPDVRFGRGQSPATGLTPTQFTQALSEAFGAKVADRLQAKGVVVPLADQTKLPAHVVPFLRDGDIVFGFYDPRTNRTYAVLENLAPGMVKGLAMHEIGVHYGFESMLGADKYKQVMKQLDLMRRSGNVAVQKAHTEATANAARPSQVPEETLAYLVQNSPENSVIKDVIARIKAWLFSEFGIGGKYLTERDLGMLARAAVQHAARTEPGGVEAPAFMKAPELSRTPQTETEAFSKWFGDSKVVDDEGKALVVYHGTKADFDVFDTSRYSMWGEGAFFTSDPKTAEVYANNAEGSGAPRIVPVYLKIESEADGSIVDRGIMGMTYQVKNPANIKSATGNRGTFDPKDPDIRFSRTRNLFEPDPWSAPEPTRTDRAIYELQNGRIDLKRVQQAITAARGAIDQKFDAQLAETLYPGRVARRTDLFLDREVKPLLAAMAASKATMDELADYLIARHAPERNAQVAKVNPDLPDGGAGRNSKGELMTNEAAAAYLAGIPPARRAELAALAEKVDAITAGTRGLLVAEGLEKADTVAAWQGAYKNYVPLFKDEAEHPHPQGTGFNVKGPASKRSTGSTKQVTNVIAHVLMQREAAITRAEKNRVGLALYGLALSNPNRGFWTTIKPGMDNDAIGRELQGMGVDPTVAEAGMDKVPTIRTVDPLTQKVVDRPNPIYKSMPGAITLKVNGEDRVLLINTTNERGLRMAEALKNLDGMTKFDLAGSIVGKTTRWMAAINTQYNPAFGLVNLVRDTLGGAVNIGSTKLRGKGLKVLADVPMAMQGIARELSGGGETSEWSKLWKQFQDDGGRTGYREVFAQAQDRADAIERELKAAQSAGKLTPGKVWHAALDLLDGFNTTLENAVRLAAYKNALDAGMTRPEAARLGRELTVDFNRKGRLGRELGPLYAFFNASVQGGARTLEALRGPTGGKIIAGGLALGALQALMLLAAGYDDDEIPEYVKTRTLIIPLLGKEKKFVAIPYPLGLHVIPNLGRITTELALNGGKEAGKRAFNAVGEIAAAFNPLGGGNIFTADGALKTVAPTVVDPLIEAGYNRNFAGNRIEREARGETDTRPGFQRAKEATLRSTSGQVYLGISKAINTMTGGTDYEKGLASPTPEMVRHLAQTAGGGVLREFEKTVDSSVKAMTGEKVKMSGIPVLGRFYGEVDDDQVQASRYYDAGRKLDKLQNSLKAAQAAGDGAAMLKLIEENPELGMARAHDQVQREIAKLNKAAISTVGDRDTIEAIDKARVEAMRGLNDAIRAMEEAEGKVTPGQRLRAAVAGK